MRFLLLLKLCLLLALSHVAAAQELTPRAYWPAPKGTQVITVGIVHTSGDTIPDPSLPIAGVDSDINTGLVAYLQTIELWGRTSNVILEVPYSDGETTGRHTELGLVERDYKGLGDVGLTVSVNLWGAPSMTLADFADLRVTPRPIIGASLKVVAPTGDYDSDRIVNVGANRWAAKFEVGSIWPLNRKWLLEAEVGSWIFEDNDDFLGMTRKQDSIQALELHLVRRFGPAFWASLDMNAYKGGRSEVNGRHLDDIQRDSKFGFTLAYPVARNHVIKASWATGSVNDSDEDFDYYSLSYSHLF